MLGSGHIDEVEKILLPIKGIGHYVIKNFIMLCKE